MKWFQSEKGGYRVMLPVPFSFKESLDSDRYVGLLTFVGPSGPDGSEILVQRMRDHGLGATFMPEPYALGTALGLLGVSTEDRTVITSIDGAVGGMASQMFKVRGNDRIGACATVWIALAYKGTEVFSAAWRQSCADAEAYEEATVQLLKRCRVFRHWGRGA